MKVLDVIDIIMKIIFVISFIIIVIWSVQILLGGGPNISQFNSMLIVMIVTILFGVMKLMYNLNREVGEIKISMKHSFDRVKEDMELIKKKLKV